MGEGPGARGVWAKLTGSVYARSRFVTFLPSRCRKGVEWYINRREIAGLVGIARWNNAIGVPLGRFRVGLVT